MTTMKALLNLLRIAVVSIGMAAAMLCIFMGFMCSCFLASAMTAMLAVFSIPMIAAITLVAMFEYAVSLDARAFRMMLEALKFLMMTPWKNSYSLHEMLADAKRTWKKSADAISDAWSKVAGRQPMIVDMSGVQQPDSLHVVSVWMDKADHAKFPPPEVYDADTGERLC